MNATYGKTCDKCGSWNTLCYCPKDVDIYKSDSTFPISPLNENLKQNTDDISPVFNEMFDQGYYES